MHAKRPGIELVVAAHKSVGAARSGRPGRGHALHFGHRDGGHVGVPGRLDGRPGGRRGRSQTRVPTNGLVWARTRHATSRAGDPEPHDHILIANLCRISDDKGGWKALDTAASATSCTPPRLSGGWPRRPRRSSSATPSSPTTGRRGGSATGASPACPRGPASCSPSAAAEITAAVEHQGYDTYQARQVAARGTRKAKRHTPPGDLMAGLARRAFDRRLQPRRPPSRPEQAAAGRGQVRPAVLTERQLTALAGYLLGPSGRLADQKVFTRADVAVAAGPLLFGFGPRELLRVVQAVCAHPDAVPLAGVKAARDQAYAPACVIAKEAAIALKAALQADRRDAPGGAPGGSQLRH